MKIKVAFNSVLGSPHQVRGIGSYANNLLEQLRKMDSIELQEFSDFTEVVSADIIHLPFFDLFYHSLPLNKKFPTIVTIHDVTPLVFPKYFPAGIKGRLNLAWQKLSLKSVSAVITVSSHSKEDIVRYLGVRKEKIFITPEAPAQSFRVIKDQSLLAKVSKKYHLPGRFALYIGNVNWNKNIIGLTAACLEAGIDLVIVGKAFEEKRNLDHPEMRSYVEFLNKFSRNPMIHILGYVKDEDLVKIMNLASVFLFPSFYEGFGLPVLEAQACGIPVITSKTSSLPEVAGEGAIYVDPFKVRDLTEAILEILSNKKRAQKLITAGFENSARFNWQNTANQTREVYQHVVGDKPL